MAKTILFTVTNDLSYDQRMHRICGTLAEHGYMVTLVGRTLPHSIPLENKPFHQVRLGCRFHKGFLFYAEYNLRLFLFLMKTRCDAVCSIDLDTLPAGCLATLLRRKKRVFDAHEYFTEVPEVVGRSGVRSFWEMIARICLPFYRFAYTVGPGLASIFEKKYRLKFGVVRNVPYQSSPVWAPFPNRGDRIILYQGALNAGRGIETALMAMQSIDDVQLWLAGEGDLSDELRQLAARLGVESKVKFLGYVKPADLKNLTAQAWLGLNLLENRGLSYYYSLANKFFDCVQAGVPVLTMDFPEYSALNEQYPVAVLLKTLRPETVAAAIEHLKEHPKEYERLQKNCEAARKTWHWEQEQTVLLDIWRAVFTPITTSSLSL